MNDTGQKIIMSNGINCYEITQDNEGNRKSKFPLKYTHFLWLQEIGLIYFLSLSYKCVNVRYRWGEKKSNLWN